VVLSPSFGDVEEDLRFIAKEQLPGPGIRRFSLNHKQSIKVALLASALLPIVVTALPALAVLVVGH
jgi:hypothetical protein